MLATFILTLCVLHPRHFQKKLHLRTIAAAETFQQRPPITGHKTSRPTLRRISHTQPGAQWRLAAASVASLRLARSLPTPEPHGQGLSKSHLDTSVCGSTNDGAHRYLHQLEPWPAPQTKHARSHPQRNLQTPRKHPKLAHATRCSAGTCPANILNDHWFWPNVQRCLPRPYRLPAGNSKHRHRQQHTYKPCDATGPG